MRSFKIGALIAALGLLGLAGAAVSQNAAADNFESWPVLKSSFPSTSGNGVMIKGYDPVILGGKCVTTFMALDGGEVYFNIVEFEAVPAMGGTLCTNGKWRAFDNSASGTTPYRVFFKDGVFRGSPQ